MRHDLVTLDLLLAIAHTKSITRGAERMHLALAAASKRVTDLEVRLGVKLFVRRARGVEPTDACSVLLKHLNTVRAGLDAFDRDASEFSRGIRGYARVAISAGVVADDLFRNLAAFTSANTEVHVTVREVKGQEVQDLVATGAVDVGIFIRGVGGTTLMTWPLAKGRWTVLVPERHVLSARLGVTMEELLSYELVGSDRSGLLAGLMARAAALRGRQWQPRVEVDSIDMAAALVEAGVGLALGTEAATLRCRHSYRVKCVPLIAEWSEYELVLATSRQTDLPVVTEHLVRSLRCSSHQHIDELARAA